MTINTKDKLAGILIPAFALQGKGNLGIGDTQAVKEAIDFCHNNYFGVLQLLPINETGNDNSPYNAISALALDPVYIHLSIAAPNIVPGLEEEDLPKDIFSNTVIDYKQVKSLKTAILKKCFERFELGKTENNLEFKTKFENFLEQNKEWLADYSLFRTIAASKDGDARWALWGKLDSIKAAKDWISNPEQSEYKKQCRFYSFVQWIAHEQWLAVKNYADARSVKLFGDIPFGVSRYSADVWARPDLFDLQWSGGAPPERFFQADDFTAIWGQNWGIPLYKWAVHEKENYHWWNCRVQQVTKYFHGFRLDHVLGFFRIYAFPWLPEQNSTFTHLSPTEAKELTGGFLPQFMPRDDKTKESASANCHEGKVRLNVILKAAADSIVIAEDLGVVPSYVRPALQELGIPGFSIPLFERNEIDRSFVPSDQLPGLNLGTYGTHDNEPLASYYENLVSWWHGEDGHNGWLEVQRLMRFLHLDANQAPKLYTDDLACTFFKILFSSPCWLVILMITDLLGTKQRFNRPGTSNASNWSERLEKPLADYALDKVYANKIKYANELIVQTNRQPNPLTKHLPEISATKLHN